jgi:hypothetical protein
LSCEKCNIKKGIKDIKEFLKKDPSKLEKILKQAIRPLADAAAVNTTRLALLRQSCRTDKYGFPSRYVPRFKFIKNFQTGDIVKAVVTNGKKIGTYIGRVAVRSTGSFNISSATGLIQGINHKYCKPIHKKDGYSYAA